MAVAKTIAKSATREKRGAKTVSPRAKKPVRTQEERNALAREKMSRAALELFALQGFHATTLADVGARAGYSRALVHHYFGTKEALAELLLEELMARESHLDLLQCSETTTGIEAWHNLERHTRSVWQGYCDLQFENDDDFSRRCAVALRSTAFSAEPHLEAAGRELGGRLLSLLVQVFRLCVRDGILRDDIDVEQTATFYMSSVGGLSQVLRLGLIDKKAAPTMIEPLRAYLNSLRK
jgi:AcrR family transcriptional regulator